MEILRGRGYIQLGDVVRLNPDQEKEIGVEMEALGYPVEVRPFSPSERLLRSLRHLLQEVSGDLQGQRVQPSTVEVASEN